MWGGTEQIKTEAPKTETPEAKAARETKDFGDNLNKVKDFLNAPTNKTEEQEKQISWLLDSKFQTWLNNLPCGDVKEIDGTIQSVLANTTLILDPGEKAVLQNLQTLLKPLITEDKAVAKFEKDATNKVTTKWKETIKYNIEAKKWGDFLSKTIAKINGAEYQDLPGQATILEALKSPTKENITSLQQFLYDNIPANNQTARDTFLRNNQKKGAWDWMYWTSTDTSLDDHLKAFIDFKDTNAKINTTDLPAARLAADQIAKANDEWQTKVETNKDNWASLAIINSKITYEHPERADKNVKVSDDMKTINYRGAVFNVPVNDIVAINKTKTTWWMSFTPENFITVLNPIESKNFTDRKEQKDKELDAKVMTYDAKTNNYVYGGKYISRDAIGTGTDKMTLETFQTEVDKMNMNTTNEYRTNDTRTSADGTVTTKIKDFEYENGYKIKTTTLDNTTKNVATTKVEVKRGDKEKTVTKTLDAAGRTDTFTKVKTNGDVKKQKTRTFDDEGRVVDFSKTKEDKDSFKEKATTKELAIDTKTTDVIPASAADISKALNDISKKTPLTLPMPINGVPITVNVPTNSLFNNYDIKNSGEKINISLKKGWIPLSQPDFDTMFKTLLTDAGITKLAMKEYNEQGSKTEKDNVTTKSVTERSFTVSEGTSQNKPASQKIIAGDQKWTIQDDLV